MLYYRTQNTLCQVPYHKYKGPLPPQKLSYVQMSCLVSENYFAPCKMRNDDKEASIKPKSIIQKSGKTD